jgi:vacuolar-type H+-ATPase subunit E/Vma4
MEEIIGTEALEQEILDDARRRADRILRRADEEARAWEAQTDRKIQQALEALEHEYQAKREAAEQEMRSRLPLEKQRLEIEYRDKVLRISLEGALAAVEPRLFGAWCLRRLMRTAELVRGSVAKVLVHGLDDATVQQLKELFADSPAVSVEVSTSMKAPGITVEPPDGSYHISITQDELVAWLLDERRGELAAALFGSSQ